MNNYWDSFDCEVQCEELEGLTEEEIFIISAFNNE